MIGDNIRKLRKAKGWTQETLGEKIGSCQHTISAWESGIVPLPQLYFIIEMKKAFNCKWEDILGE